MTDKKPDKTNRPSDLEVQVLGILWEHGACTVRDVMGYMTDGKTRAYTTVLTILQVMEKKGLATHTHKGQANVYKAAYSREKIVNPLINRLVDNVFSGSAAGLVMSLVDDGKLSQKEIAEIKQLLNNTDKKRPKAKMPRQ